MIFIYSYSNLSSIGKRILTETKIAELSWAEGLLTEHIHIRSFFMVMASEMIRGRVRRRAGLARGRDIAQGAYERARRNPTCAYDALFPKYRSSSTHLK